MQKTKKHLLGLGGLALVAAMTTFAYTIPVEAATSTGGNTEINVVVYSADYDTKIESPLDGSTTTNKTITVSNIYSHASAVNYTLTYVAEDGTKTVTQLTAEDIAGVFDASGVKEFTLNLDNFSGYGHYILTSKVTAGGGETKEDSTEFDYVAANITSEEAAATNGDPIVTFDYSEGVASMDFTVYKKNGTRVLSSNSFVFNVPVFGVAGTGNITLPFLDAGLESGDYYIIANAYDVANAADAAIITGIRYDFSYTKPQAPEVPDTGALLSVLNISRADFTITCLVGFIVVTFAALFVMRKSKKS